jgi:hypothetical protein
LPLIDIFGNGQNDPQTKGKKLINKIF